MTATRLMCASSVSFTLFVITILCYFMTTEGKRNHRVILKLEQVKPPFMQVGIMGNQEMEGFLPTLRFYEAEMDEMVGMEGRAHEGLLGGMGLTEKRG